jgi:ligand-binding SRPBCC domain-containing protein
VEDRLPSTGEPVVLEHTQVVPRPRAEVFAFFSDPANLARITPPRLGFRLVGHDPAGATGTHEDRVEGDEGRRSDGHRSPESIVMAAGLRLHYRVRPLGVPQRWTSLISVWQPPDRFVDEQLRGPYRRWHHLHEFEEVTGGTRIHDRVEYEMPFGIIGRLARRLFVSRELDSIFDYRTRVIEQLFGTMEDRA